MLDQIKTISDKRLLKPFIDQNKNCIKLNEQTLTLLKNKVIKYIKLILCKKAKSS